MKTLLVVLIFGLSGCFSGGSNSVVNGEPEQFTVNVDPMSPDNIDDFLATKGLKAKLSRSGSPQVEQWEPQNVIRVYSAPPGQYCPPCQRFDAWANSLTKQQREELSVEFIKAVPPAWVKTYPTYHWKVGDEWWQAEGWTDIETFAKTYNQTLKQGKKKGSTTSPSDQSPERRLPRLLLAPAPASSEVGQATPSRSDMEFISFFPGRRRWP